MIISKPYGVIYVAVPKTASQSLSLLLDRRLKADDVPYEAESMCDFHATLREAEAVTHLPLENYWSFAFVRNPFDRFVSYCAGHLDGFAINPGATLWHALELARQGENRWLVPQATFIEGVSKVYRFEQINEAIADIADRLQIDLDELPRVNISDREPYRGYFDTDLKGAVSEFYRGDLLNLDYRF
ncbi:MAG: sulfotransferase family 2 domain-containing protein [Stenotrophomonas sp.]|uniref:sulfotransferase family 2 domain-containing protein n=1 Tax=Stenotrophomonas sp. TaxID=69392 RepID=UPI003D6CCEAE